MKIISFVLLGVLVILPCSRLKLLDATSQEWAGGIYEAGYGTNYKMTLLARGGSDKLAIHDLWIGEDHFNVQAFASQTNRSETAFARKDTLYVRAGITYQPDENGRYIKKGSTDTPRPEGNDGLAILGYTWKGKQKYLEIASFRELEKLIYP